MLWLCDIKLPAARSGVARARALADALDAEVPRELRDDLRLLISEVTANAVRHGSEGIDAASDASIRVRLGLRAGSVRVEVHDRGPGFQPAPRGPRSRLDGGWGVHFVRTLAHRWGAGRVAGGAWVVWFELRLPEPRADAIAGGRAATGPRCRHDLASTA